MENVISTFGLITGLLIALVFLAWVLLSLLEYIFHYIEQLRYDKSRETFVRQIHDLGRWCSYDFPILGDIEEEYARAWSDGRIVDISTFRDTLRRKYKKKEGEK